MEFSICTLSRQDSWRSSICLSLFEVTATVSSNSALHQALSISPLRGYIAGNKSQSLHFVDTLQEIKVASLRSQWLLNLHKTQGKLCRSKQIPKTTFLVFNCPGVPVGQGGRQGQRHKNHRGILALPSGKFLRVHIVFAHNPWNCTGKFPDGLESFRIVWKVSGWSGKFLDNLESFRIIWQVSLQSGKFWDNLEDFRITWKVSR